MLQNCQANQMPNTNDDLPVVDKNQSIIDNLRAEFSVMTQHLTPEIEPATTYLPHEASAENPE